MEWKYIKKLKSIDLISEYERLVNYAFCDSFRECVIACNGGRPDKKVFNTNKEKEREIKSFLSFNREDRETVWKVFEWNREELSNRYIPFAIDNFGNIVCFDKENDNIVFLNHENSSIEFVADNFEIFLSKLYS